MTICRTQCTKPQHLVQVQQSPSKSHHHTATRTILPPPSSLLSPLSKVTKTPTPNEKKKDSTSTHPTHAGLFPQLYFIIHSRTEPSLPETPKNISMTDVSKRCPIPKHGPWLASFHCGCSSEQDLEEEGGEEGEGGGSRACGWSLSFH